MVVFRSRGEWAAAWLARYGLDSRFYRVTADGGVAMILPGCCPGAERLVGWLPCGCLGGPGHRTVLCLTCGRELRLPVCIGKARSVSDHGIGTEF